MAYRRSRSRGRSFRGRGSRRRSFSTPRRSRARGGRRMRARSFGQTVRLVIEQPRETALRTLQAQGVTQDVTPPRKAQF